MNRMSQLLIAILAIFLASTPGIANAASQRNDLPAAIGSFALGDNQFEIEERVGARSEFCFGCRGYSDVLTSTGARLRLADDGSLEVAGTSSRDSSFNLYFSGGRLVMLRFSGAYASDSFDIQRFVSTYGEPTSLREWRNGLSWATWTGKRRVLQVAFLNKEHRLYPGIDKGIIVEVSLAEAAIAGDVLQEFR